MGQPQGTQVESERKQCTTFFLANSRLQKAPHQPADVSRSRSSVLSDPTKTAQNSKPQATCPKMRFPHLCIGVKINSIVISAVVLSLLLPALFLYCCRWCCCCSCRWFFVVGGLATFDFGGVAGIIKVAGSVGGLGGSHGLGGVGVVIFICIGGVVDFVLCVGVGC